eukprot:TRINITY_DN8333_c0_g1_i4.p1 TRINITY_DN8333_c0_g1~~TRINITY_DN8333_c0_g1_i4.p1  ORF type:complete len:142 (-),score=31.52 TRINITY_DN8333_c0_g1_i4:11-436(-)
MQAANDKERTKWIKAFHDLQLTKDPRKDPTSIYESYMWKLGGKSKDVWQKRYFILLCDRLQYFKKKLDEKELGSVYFLSASQPNETGGDTFSFHGTAGKNGKEKEFKFKARSLVDKQNWMKEIGRAVQQECRDRSRMPSSA